MAIFSFAMDTVSKDKCTKGKGKRSASAAQKAAYIKREGRYSPSCKPSPKPATAMPAKAIPSNNDQSAADNAKYILREGQFQDRHDDEIVFKGGGNMPKWSKTNPQQDDQHFWNAADIYERDNGRTARTFIIALPRELTDEQRLDLAKNFSNDLAKTNRGEKLPYSFAIHQDQENHNPHLHLKISERVNDGLNRNASTWFKRANAANPAKGGARKTEDLKAKSWLYGARERWALACNDALKTAGSSEAIDHRSLKNQGKDRIPTVHLGTGGYAKNNDGLTSLKERKAHNEAAAVYNREQATVERMQTHGIKKTLWTMAFQTLPNPTPYNAKIMQRPRKIFESKPLPKNGTCLQWIEYMMSTWRSIMAESERIQALKKHTAELEALVYKTMAHMDEQRARWWDTEKRAQTWNARLFITCLHEVHPRKTKRRAEEEMALAQVQAELESTPEDKWQRVHYFVWIKLLLSKPYGEMLRPLGEPKLKLVPKPARKAAQIEHAPAPVEGQEMSLEEQPLATPPKPPVSTVYVKPVPPWLKPFGKETWGG
jgi:MobA/MobL family